MKKEKPYRNLKKAVAAVLCALVLLPSVGYAQLLGLDSLSAVPISSDQIGGVIPDDGNMTSGFLNRIGLGSVVNAFNSASAKINSMQCYSADAQKALDTADKVDGWTFGGLKLLTGDMGEATMLKNKIIALDAAKSCTENKLKTVKSTSIASLTQGQMRQSQIQQYSTELTTIQKRLDELNAQYRNATRSFWKTILVKTLLETTRAVSANLVNSMTNKYKVVDFQQYADAVAAQVYTTDFIRKNAVDNADQLVLRTMLNNPIAQSQVQPVVYQRADAALGFNADDLSVYDPDFYTKAAHVGAGDANPYVLHVDAIGRAAQAQATGQQSARNEIALGNGLKAPRDCSGSLAQQAAIDQSYKALNAEYEDRKKLLVDLQSYQQNMKNFTTQQALQVDADVARAQKDFDDASNRLAAMPKQYDNSVVQICSGIVSPASLVDKGIESAFNQFAKNLGDYNDNNLPFFVNFISDIGTQIGTSLIFGGNTKNVVLSEMNNIETAAGMGLALAVASSKENSQKKYADMQKGASIDYEAKTQNGQTVYYLSWNVDKGILPDANYITISGGAGLPSNILNKKIPVGTATAQDREFRVNVTTPGTYTYVINVYSASNKLLVSNSVSLTIQAQSVYYNSGPLVRGAFTEKSLEPIRGPSGIKTR